MIKSPLQGHRDCRKVGPYYSRVRKDGFYASSKFLVEPAHFQRVLPKPPTLMRLLEAWR